MRLGHNLKYCMLDNCEFDLNTVPFSILNHFKVSYRHVSCKIPSDYSFMTINSQSLPTLAWFKRHMYIHGRLTVSQE